MRHFRFFRVAALMLAAAVFLGALLAGPAAADFRFVFMADSRGHPVNDYELTGLVNDIMTLDPVPVLLVFAGDMASRGNDTTAWDHWQSLMAPISQKMYLYVSIGNHELYDDSLSCLWDNQEAFRKAFKDYTFGESYPDNHPNYQYLAYAFTFGEGADKSLFIVLDSFYMWKGKTGQDKLLYGGITDTQLEWVNNLLDSNKDVSHRFIFTHMPLYPVDPHTLDQGDKASLVRLADILDNHKADIFFAGHEHLYDKMILNKKVKKSFQNNVVQIISGDAGAPFASAPANPKYERKTITKKDNYVVVDVKGASVEYHSYGGTRATGYQEIDSGTK